MIDSRATENGRVRRRRYLCPHGHRFTTFERQGNSYEGECEMYRQRANASVAREQQVRRELNRVRQELQDLRVSLTTIPSTLP